MNTIIKPDIDKVSARELIEFISDDLEFLLSSGIQGTSSTEAQDIGTISKWWNDYKKWLLDTNR